MKDDCTAVQTAGGQPAMYQIKLGGMDKFHGFCEEPRDGKCNYNIIIPLFRDNNNTIYS